MLSDAERDAFVRDGYLVRHLNLDNQDRLRAIDLTWSFTPATFDRANPDSWNGMVEDSCHAKTIGQRRGRVKYRECVRKETWLVDMIFANPAVLEPMKDLLGETGRPRDYIRGLYPNFPSPTTKVRAPEGHMDHHPFQLGVLIYLDPVVEDGGGFVVWPGSHKIMRHGFPDKASIGKSKTYKTLIAECEKTIEPREITGGPGTVVFWHHRLLHTASTNRSKAVRHALFGDFLRADWEEQMEARVPHSADMWEDWAVSEREAVPV